MRIRVLGGGWYGCSIAVSLIADGHEVELHELADRLFAGASGANPARLHIGTHYPRSRLTRAACQEHTSEFMERYGELTRAVPINIYAVAEHDSLVDFGTYRQVLQGEIEFITIHDPSEFGLRSVEGAILTGERHIIIDRVREFFSSALGEAAVFGIGPGDDDNGWDWTIDCTFCAREGQNVDRYEPCVVGLAEGPTDRAVTIMDGPFPSLYPWNPKDGLSSLSSARYTPLSKECRTYDEARRRLNETPPQEIRRRADLMLEQLAEFWPACRDLYRVVDAKTAIRAMPRSGADARLVDLVQTGEKTLRVRAGKIDAVFHAERLVKEAIAA